MSRFYANIKGNRGGTSRCGTPSSGIKSHTRGWDVGVEVLGDVDCDGQDEFQVYATGGSNDPFTSKLIARIRYDDGDVLVDLIP